jgi:flagellar biosynthetic protein FlhB
MARERGQVARSPDLTGAVILLTVVTLLGTWGEVVMTRLVSLVRAPFVEGAGDRVLALGNVVDRCRLAAVGLAWPLGALSGVVVLTGLLAHQVQVRGLWSPGLLAPDLGRLGLGQGPSLAARSARGAWSLAKATVVVAVAAWAIRADLPAFARLSELDGPALARASGLLLKGMTTVMALATLVLGLADFALQWQRLEVQLRLTPEEHREDQKAVEGDPAVRARQRRVARAWSRDAAKPLEGAKLVLMGPRGLVVVLAGDLPPDGRITVHHVARGTAGAILGRSAENAGVRLVNAPALARHFARGLASRQTMPPELAAELAGLWPSET